MPSQYKNRKIDPVLVVMHIDKQVSLINKYGPRFFLNREKEMERRSWVKRDKKIRKGWQRNVKAKGGKRSTRKC